MRSSFMRSAAAASIFLMYPIDASVAQQQPTVKVDDPVITRTIESNIDKNCAVKDPGKNKACINSILEGAKTLRAHMRQFINIDIGTYTRRFTDDKELERKQRWANNAIDDLRTFCDIPLTMLVFDPPLPQFYFESAGNRLTGCMDSFTRADKAVFGVLYPGARHIIHTKATAIMGDNYKGTPFQPH